jgi:chaperone modulatory protein CbpM
MAEPQRRVVDAVVIADVKAFTLFDLCRACGADSQQVIALVSEGVLDPDGNGPEVWLFGASALPTVRTALRLIQDLEIGFAGAALVLELLAQIESLRALLLRAGVRPA